MKGELLMYVEKTDTYTCDFCGHNAKWDASDDVHGELWSCESQRKKLFRMAITRTSFWQNEKRLCSLMTRATPESSI